MNIMVGEALHYIPLWRELKALVSSSYSCFRSEAVCVFFLILCVLLFLFNHAKSPPMLRLLHSSMSMYHYLVCECNVASLVLIIL